MKSFIAVAALAALGLSACEDSSGGATASAFGGASKKSAAADASPCTTSSLSLESSGPGVFVFTNTGTVACTLQGFPKVTPLTAAGAPLRNFGMQRAETPPKVVLLEPQGRAEFKVTSDPKGANCQNSPRLQASAPGDVSKTLEADSAMKICTYATLSPVTAPSA